MTWDDRRVYSLADVIVATAAARYATPAQIDHSLACGVTDPEMRGMLASGATMLAELEHADGHPEGLSLAVLDRREEILDVAMADIALRRLHAIMLEYRLVDGGDDETPATVLYAWTGSTGADWADDLLDRS